MCGIAGIFAYSNAAARPSRAELVAIRDRMSKRGPDGSGEWTSDDGRTILGHRRLSIIDLSDRAQQPMLSADRRLAIVFNGEIYNYRELRDALAADGETFRTTSDTEVLLALYARKGPTMLDDLRGMFAFAISDQGRGGMFLARDPYGIKPLYYAQDGGTLRFASQVKALLAGGALSREPDPAGVVGFHLFGSVPEPFTLYRSIRCLPAGTNLWVDGNGVGEPVAFASVAGVLAAAADGRSDSGESLEQGVRTALLDSVRHHLVADVEVGAFLSGGVDSGTLVGLMRDAGQEKIRTITLGFEEFQGSPSDEAPLAARVAQHYGTKHTTRIVRRDEFEADLPDLLDAMDQPSVDGVNTWFVSKAARELGLKVALSGLGGDELLGGYSTFRDVPRWRRLVGPFAQVPGLGEAVRRTGRALFPGLAQRNPKLLSLVKYAGSYPGAYLLKRGVVLPPDLGEVLDPEFARAGLERLQVLDIIRRSMTPDPGAPAARVAALEASNYMRNQLLRDADWAGMAHSLEIRVPLVDYPTLKRLAPSLRHLSGDAGKRALGRAPSNPLPDEIVDRPKTGFSIPTQAWTETVASSVQNDRLTSRRWGRWVLAQFASEPELTRDALAS